MNFPMTRSDSPLLYIFPVSMVFLWQMSNECARMCPRYFTRTFPDPMLLLTPPTSLPHRESMASFELVNKDQHVE